MTSTVPAVPGGVVTVIAVEVRFVTVAGLPPISTLTPTPAVEKFVPLIVIDSPPVASPEFGDTAVIVGVGALAVGIVNSTVDPPVVPAELVAVTLK
jgi:hypothetical protein